MQIDIHRLFHVRWTAALQALAAAAGIATLALPLEAQQSPSQYRSVTDVRQRLIDEHDRPYVRETQSHRGWEVREPQYTIFTNTKPDDARWAAVHAAQAWSQAAALADRWTQVHHNPDFALNALQVTIDSEPARDRSAPLTTMSVVAIQTQVTINVAPGQPTLTQQVVRLREGAAFAMLHAAGVDAVAPPWVVAGLASVAGRAGLSREEIQQAEATPNPARFGGQQWRYSRSEQDVLGYPESDHATAGRQVAFLLTGDDAQHAPALFADLRDATAQAGATAAAGGAFRTFPGNSRPPQTNTPFDQLMEQIGPQYAAWQKNPEVGQPIFQAAADASPDVVAAEQEMIVLLKLERRMERPTTGAGATGGSSTTFRSAGAIKTKIVAFDRASGPRPEASKQPTKLASFAEFASKLTNPAEPVWATLDADGNLLLSTDEQRINQLLGLAEQRYAFEASEGRITLVRRLDNGKRLRGWLEDNQQDRSRPLAKFEVVDSRAQGSRTKSVPPVAGNPSAIRIAR